MPTVIERVSVLETKVDNLNDKIDNIQDNVKDNHQDLKTQLRTMYDASCSQHAELNKKITELEKFKNKWMYILTGGIAVFAYAIGHLDIVNRIFG